MTPFIVFVGGKMVDDGHSVEILQARLLESEHMARHFEGIVLERDFQLNKANRVSKILERPRTSRPVGYPTARATPATTTHEQPGRALS